MRERRKAGLCVFEKRSCRSEFAQKMKVEVVRERREAVWVCLRRRKRLNAVRVNSSSTTKWVMCVAHDSKLRCLLLLSDTCSCR